MDEEFLSARVGNLKPLRWCLSALFLTGVRSKRFHTPRMCMHPARASGSAARLLLWSPPCCSTDGERRGKKKITEAARKCCVLWLLHSPVTWGLLSCVEGGSSAGVQLHGDCRRLRGSFDNRRRQEEADTAASLASAPSRAVRINVMCR